MNKPFIIIGRDASHNNFKWVTIFGDKVQADRDYFIGTSQHITLPGNFNRTKVFGQLSDALRIAIAHSLAHPNEVPEFWLDQVRTAIEDFKHIVVGCHNPKHPIEKINQNSFACGGCMIAKYCSRECQKQHWPTHRCIKVKLQETTRTLGPDVPFQPGQGVFATHDIAQGQVVMHYRGVWRDGPTTHQDFMDGAIAFHSGKIMVDASSLTRQIIDPFYRPVGENSRDLAKLLAEPTSIYPKFAEENVTLVRHEMTKRAFLIALIPIKAGDEIFYHLGFNHHFFGEIETYKFSLPFTTGPEGRTLKVGSPPSGIPNPMTWNHPGFIEYVKSRWADATDLVLVDRSSGSEGTHVQVFLANETNVPEEDSEAPASTLRVHHEYLSKPPARKVEFIIPSFEWNH